MKMKAGQRAEEVKGGSGREIWSPFGGCCALLEDEWWACIRQEDTDQAWQVPNNLNPSSEIRIVGEGIRIKEVSTCAVLHQSLGPNLIFPPP